MRKILAFTLTITAVGLLGCDAGETDDAATPGSELQPVPEQQEVPDEMLVSASEFEAVGGEAGAVPVRGTAELRRVTDDGSLELHVRVEGLTEGEHAWHIHSAPCGQQGDIMVPLSRAGGQDAIHGDLNVGSDGVVDERVTISAEHVQHMELESARALNIHRGSGDNPGPPVACANIGGSTAGASGTGSGTTGTGY